MMVQFMILWLWPLALGILGGIACLVTALPRFRRFHQLAEWKRIVSVNSSYWPIERAHRSWIVRAAHSVSILIRCTSALQYVKTLFKAGPLTNGGEQPRQVVPAWVVEIYVLIWIAYTVLVVIYFEFTQPSSNPLLLAVLIYRIIHVFHGNLYYSILRAMYVGKHSVHSISRDLVLLCISYIELCLLFAAVYLSFGSCFCPQLAHFGDAMYFSVVTITTLGYGDFQPIASGTRFLSSVQALFGIALLALAIARFTALVSTPTEHSAGARTERK